MSYNNRMGDTPWHISYINKKEGDPRRHKSRCSHYYDGECGVYNTKCTGSSHCIYYHELTEYDIMKMRELQESEALAQRERDLFIKKRKEMFTNNTINELTEKYKDVKVCPVCERKISDGRCFYCGFNISIPKPIKQKNNKKKKHRQTKQNICTCKYQKNGVCKVTNFKCTMRGNSKDCFFFDTNKY